MTYMPSRRLASFASKYRNAGHRPAGEPATRRARDEPADEEPGQIRRERQQQVVEARAEQRRENHRPTTEAIGETAQQGRADELHRGPQRGEQADVERGTGDVTGTGPGRLTSTRFGQPPAMAVPQAPGAPAPPVTAGMRTLQLNMKKLGFDVAQHVSIVGPLNLPSQASFHASQMLSRNVLTLVTHLMKDNALVLDAGDEITGAMLVALDGQVRA